MIRRYELWLDESGKFKEEAALKERKFKPSLVGGILVEKSIVSRIDFENMIDPYRNHAMELNKEDKKEYVLPVLERLKTEYGAKQVFFENADYEDENTNRQLYLRIIAEGLLQLFQTLNAQSEKVVLDVLIAQRQDMESPVAERRILEKEYIDALKNCIEKKKKEHRLFVDENSELFFVVHPAHREKKLQLADFACNTRLTRDSNIFKDVRNRVTALYEDAYIFNLSEISSENYIKRSLSQGHLADAVMELYTTQDELAKERQLDLILERIKYMDYRWLKAQLKECVSEITAYAALQGDYKVGEKFLLNVKNGFIEMMEKNGYSCLNLKLALLLQLTDMFLREGNIVAARNAIEECKKTHYALGNSLEEVFSYYQLKEKEALLLINEFNYERAYEILEATGKVFQSFMQAVCADESLKKRFSNLRSEYYGDTLCMQLYAMMFMQREQPELYKEMCEKSDLAMKNYPQQEGELERHRQYRSHIELENGNYEEALKWLIKAQCWENTDLTVKNLIDFLKQICRVENEISCQYYLMYYLLILSESKWADNELSNIMWKALKNQKELLRICFLESEPKRAEDTVEVEFEGVQQEDSGVMFHPMEVIYWKYASYLYGCGRYNAAYLYYCKAEQICFAEDNCYTMQITGLGIMAEKICSMLNEEKSKIDLELMLFRQRIKNILDAPLTTETKSFVSDIQQLVEEACTNMDSIQKEKLWAAARRIAY